MKNKKIKICVVGTGYVGLVTGACFADMGHQVICVDKDAKKISQLENGVMPIYESGLQEIVSRNTSKGRLKFISSLEKGIKEPEVIFICVGTPAKSNGDSDLSFVQEVAREIAQTADSDKIIVEKSTVPVQTGDEIQKALDFYSRNNKNKFCVVSNPEFLREGSAVKDFMKPDRIVLGVNGNEIVKKTMLDIYASIDAPKIITDLRSAELIKHASNTFLATKISFINLIAQVCEKTGADVQQVAEGMGFDRRIGMAFLDAGIGYGGSCFPKDAKAFASIVNNLGLDAGFVESVENINKNQRSFFVEKIKKIIPSLSGKTIGVLGLAFKPNTDDMREAPSIDIINKLLSEGAKIKAFDPLAINSARKIFGNKIKFAKDVYEAAQGADAIVILTECDKFKNMDLRKIKKLLKEPKIIDGRNIFNPLEMRKLGFNYLCIGRK